jgi:hypothetical protein
MVLSLRAMKRAASEFGSARGPVLSSMIELLGANLAAPRVATGVRNACCRLGLLENMLPFQREIGPS